MAEAPDSKGTSKRIKAYHNIPLPQDIECSKLDWLLQINEEYFEEHLRTVVSGFLFIAYVPLLISSYSTNVNVLKA